MHRWKWVGLHGTVVINQSGECKYVEVFLLISFDAVCIILYSLNIQ